MTLDVDIQTACKEPTPKDSDVRLWVAASFDNQAQNAEICLRLVSYEEMTELNQTYRGKPSATNVLSFPAQLPQELQLPLLGDIVICAAVVNREASEQRKASEAHWAHMVVHGTLHLLGYDHQQDQEAAIMEAKETEILRLLNFDCPYQTHLTAENLH